MGDHRITPFSPYGPERLCGFLKDVLKIELNVDPRQAIWHDDRENHRFCYEIAPCINLYLYWDDSLGGDLKFIFEKSDDSVTNEFNTIIQRAKRFFLASLKAYFMLQKENTFLMEEEEFMLKLNKLNSRLLF